MDGKEKNEKISLWKGAEHYWALGKFKLKPLWDIPSYTQEQIFRRLVAQTIGKDMKQLKLS